MACAMKKSKDEIVSLINTLNLPYLRIALTNDCNGNCFFCHNEGMRFGFRGENAKEINSILDLENWEKISDYFNCILKKVVFVGGEPTLLKNLLDIVKIFSKKGFYTKITSNGFLLNEEKQLILKDAGLNGANVSFHHSNRIKYHEAFRVNNKYDIVLKNISTLSKYFDDTKINFVSHDREDFMSQANFFSDLSSKHNLLISFLYIIQDKANIGINEIVMKYLDDNFKEVKRTETKDKFRYRVICEYQNYAKWEFDMCGTEEYKTIAMNNDYCKKCPKLKQCFEGPYAMRMLPNGDLKSCLIRNDDIIKFEDYIF